ncbi:hypothetical protein F8M41_017908 [Gigaspora margarita]|uniref:Uncharacterized protein n=1 Tax=Gigaspora margarita TaxID=4874 RepID=A0A8H4B2V7_GIGMA|nr:hypothetical protein F8M41_017908 [Gigaspora margarita]
MKLKRQNIDIRMSGGEETIDFSLITIQNEDFVPIPTIRNIDSKIFPELLITEDYIAVSSNGAHLCLSGLISHVECGFVETLNGFASIYANYVRENIFAVNMVGGNGDSGGSVFSYKQDMQHVSLNGIVSSGHKNFVNGGVSGTVAVIAISSILSSISNVINITIVTTN